MNEYFSSKNVPQYAPCIYMHPPPPPKKKKDTKKKGGKALSLELKWLKLQRNDRKTKEKQKTKKLLTLIEKNKAHETSSKPKNITEWICRTYNNESFVVAVP